MGTIQINGQTYQHSGGSISIRNGEVRIDGKPVDAGPLPAVVEVRILDGAITNVFSDGSVYCADVGGMVQAGGSIQCEDVAGNASAGGSISCDNIGGNAIAGGSISADIIYGQVKGA